MKKIKLEYVCFSSGISLLIVWMMLKLNVLSFLLLTKGGIVRLLEISFFITAIARLLEASYYFMKEGNLYQKNLYSIPLNEKFIDNAKKGKILLGKGFLWTVKHLQKIYDLKTEKKYSKIIEKGREEGNPILHNIGIDKEKDITLDVSYLKTHTLVAGTTRVGKTVALRLLISQMIARGEPVVIIDPKGDSDMLDDVYSVAKACGREKDFYFFSLAHPAKSASYNPLSSFGEASDIASRLASLLPQDPKSKPFTDYAETVMTTVCNALLSINIKPTIRLIHEYTLIRMEELYHVFKYSLGKVKEMTPEVKKSLENFKRLAQIDSVYVENRNKEIKSKLIYFEHFENLYNHYTKSKEHYMKMTSSLEPLFITLNSGEIGELLNQSPADITWDNVVYGNKITYFYLASMFKGSLKSGGIGKLALQDLLQFIGREYAFGGKTELNLNIFVDEFYNVIFDGYVDLLNKAGGTNTRVFLAMQTTDDAVSALGEQAKARQILANTNTKIFLRVPELEVAKVFTELTPKDYVMTRMKTLASGANSNLDGSLFGTNVGDRLIPEETNLVTEEFLSSLPVGQAFLRYQGKIYKVRIPYLNIEHEESFSKKILSFEEDIEDEHLKNLSFEG